MIFKSSENRISSNFFANRDVVDIAKDLLGKKICTNIKNQFTSGMIIETEAYKGIKDKASHAFGGRRTARNSAMFEKEGTLYVYICYGIHCLFNIVCNKKNIPDAILIRAIHPMHGLDVMRRRTNKKSEKRIASGPGKLSKALGIDMKFNGKNLEGDNLWIENHSISEDVVARQRIGVEYAGEDSKLLRRFYIKGSPFVSVK
tara:strand:- start:308 stop:913 length:606 start_codon:yes stop_codon:yes gene_type:complete